MQISVLVVSKTAWLLNQLIESLNAAYSGISSQLQILVSWNGSEEDERKIKPGRFEVIIAQRSSYNFAKNMNSLALIAGGEYLALLNDDLILDPRSLDAAISVLEHKPDVGLVGGKLRDKQGKLCHAGINFDSRSSAYHQLENVVNADSDNVNISGVVPAVTGALMVINKHDLLKIKFSESYQTCGEDVELCLDIRENLNKLIWYCAEASGIHEAETTRQQVNGQQANGADLAKLRERHRRFLQNCDRKNLRIEYETTCKESEILRDHIANRPNPNEQQNIITSLSEQLQIKTSELQRKNVNMSTLDEKIKLLNEQLNSEISKSSKLKQTKSDLKQLINEQELRIEDLKKYSAQQERNSASLQTQLLDLSIRQEKELKKFRNPLNFFLNSRS